MAAQDPAELFDVTDDRGTPLGFAKARAAVHRDGDWHRAVHVWVVLRGAPDAEPRLLLQRRSLAKDTWPGAVDVAVGGHLRAGEGIAEALREADEEIGLAIGLDDVIALGTRAYVSHGAKGVCDREVQFAYAAIVDRPLGSFRPDPEELGGLLAIPFASARALFRGEVATARGEELGLDGGIREVAITRGDCVKRDDGYSERVVDALAALLAGGSPAPFELRSGAER